MNLTLQDRINRLVAGFHCHREQVPQLCRELCRLARDHHLGPEDFRTRLIRAGLSGPRASELKVIYQDKPELEKFLSPTAPQSWDDSLKNARQRLRKAAFGSAPTQAELILAQMAGWMHGGQIHVFDLEGCELVLRDAPDNAFELLEAHR